LRVLSLSNVLFRFAGNRVAHEWKISIIHAFSDGPGLITPGFLRSLLPDFFWPPSFSSVSGNHDMQSGELFFCGLVGLVVRKASRSRRIPQLRLFFFLSPDHPVEASTKILTGMRFFLFS